MEEQEKKKKKLNVTWNNDGTVTVEGTTSKSEAMQAAKSYWENKKQEDTQRYKSTVSEAIKKRQNPENKTAVDKMWERGSTTPTVSPTYQAWRDLNAAKKNVEQKQKDLDDYRQNAEVDWADAASRRQFDDGEKQKKQEISRAQAEQNRAVMNLDRVQMDEMSEEDRKLIDEYIRREDTASDPIDTGTAVIAEHFANNLGIDEKRLKELVSTRRREMNAQRMQETQEKAQAEVNDGWMSATWANLKTIPANLMSGLMGTMSTIHDLANQDERYSGLDPNSMGNELNVYSGAVRGQTQQNIVGTEEERAEQIESLVAKGYGRSEAEFIVNNGRKGLSTLYQAGMSAADTGARAAVGGVLGLGAGAGATIAGLNTFSQTMSDASARGATPGQAVALAVTTAGIEAMTEKYSLDELISVSKGGGAKSLALNVLRQMGVEASEEELSLIGTTLADAAIMQEKSKYNQTVAEYMAQGMTVEQAREQANWGLVQEAAETAIVSGIAGGIGGFGASVKAAYSKDGQNTTQQQVVQQAQEVQNEGDGLADAQRFAKAAEEARKDGGDINHALQQTGDEYADMMPVQEQEAKTPEQIALDDGIQKTIQANQERDRSKKREKEVYDAMKAARKDQKDLQKEIDRAETRLKETGKGSPARIQQLKAKLEQQNKLVSQIESQYQYFNGDYARNISDAVSQQQEIFTAAKDRAEQAISDYEAGKITEAQRNAEADAYNKAGAELKRLNGMTQEQYRAELAEVGLIADLNDKPQGQIDLENGVRKTLGVDSEQTQTYNNGNNTPGGMGNAGSEYQNGQQNDRAGSAGNPASGLAGVQQSNGTDNQGRGQSGGLAGDTGVLRVSDKLQEAQRKRGTQTYPVRDTTGNPESYEQALIAGRNSDQKNGWCVTPKSAQELRDGNVRTFMNESGTVGVGVAPDGDIVAVFKNRNGGPRKALDTLMPIAIEQGGDRLDCYGEGLVKAYASYGFMPVARVEFNPEYANDGWTPEKGTPYIYMMMHNGDSADKVVSNMGSYDIPSQEQLNALPTYGKDDYDSAMAYRDSLMKQRTQQVDTQDVSAQDGRGAPDGMKGTGAAEQNFSGKTAYQDLLTDENTQRDRPGDVRPMEVPKEDIYGRKVSEFAGNAYGAAVTPDRMANEIESLIQDGVLGFDRRSNRQSLENAQQYIYGSDGVKGKGEAGTRAEITRNIANGKIQDGDIEKAMLLYAKYANRKSASSQENAAEIMVDLATMANMTGRNLQLFRILRRMTPEGQLMAVEKSVQRNVESLQKSGKVKKDYVSNIDPELRQEYLDAAKESKNADTPQKQKEAEMRRKDAENAIYLSEAAKMPATFKAKWDSWRYMCMMGNVATNVRNIDGNAGFMPYKAVKDKMAAVVEKVLVPKDKRTKAIVQDSDLVAWAKQDAKTDQVKDALKYSAKLGDDVSASKLAENQRIFKSEFLENARKLSEKLPAAGDMLFKNNYYAKSLAGFLKARGYRLADVQAGKVDTKILNEARGYAIDEAMKATFNDCNAFSDFVANDLRYKGDNPVGKVLNIAGEGVLPFRRTPANILVRFAEYSPLGVGKGVWDAATKVRSGEMTAATAIDQISAGLTGTGAMVLGYALASGLFGVKIRGSEVDEDEKRQGHQKYSVEFSYNGKEYSYTIDWAAPANLPLFVGANIHDMLEKQGEDTDVSKFTAFIRGMGNMFEPMLSLSCLSSLNSLFETPKYAEDGQALYSVAANIATSYFTQGIPSLLRQADRAVDGVKQTTFANSADPTIRDIQKTAANIPFIGKAFKTDKVNEWGEKEEKGGWMKRTFDSFANPGTLKEIDNSPLEKEITRLNGAQSENVTPKDAGKVISYTDKNGGEHVNQRLTEEQHQTLATEQGQTAKAIGDKMLKSADYMALTDKQKAQALKLAYEYAQDKGRRAAMSDYPEPSGWMAGIEGKEADAIVRKVAKDTLNSAISDWTNAVQNGWSTGGNEKAIYDAYASFDSMTNDAKSAVMEDAGGDVARYLEVRENGVTTDAYLSTLKRIVTLKPEGESGKVKEYQTRKAIAGTPISDHAIDVIMRAHMPDYDPDKKGSDTTEPKYDYIRQDMGYSPSKYAQSYEIYSYEYGVGGEGTADRTRERFVNELSISEKEAYLLYKLYHGDYRPWKNE